MQRIINALAKNKNTVLFILLLIISLYFLNSRSYFHQTKFAKFSLSITGILNNLSSNIIRYSNLNKENKLLIQENLILKSDLIKNKNIETIKSKKEIYFPFSLINARIVKNNYNKKENFVIINKGEKDGIKKEMGVITSNGIVGIINNVSENYSSIISIINSNIKINAKIKNTNYFGAIGWSEKINIMTLEDIVSTAKISIGDTIISGGMSSYFPSNLEIGKIVTLKKKNEGYYSIEVELFNNPSQWEYVYVIKNMDIMEINNLEEKIKMINENLKIFFQFISLILAQIIILDNINLFGFLNPIIYILFIITYRFDQNQTLFIFLSFLLGLTIDLLTQSSGANTISCLILSYIGLLSLTFLLKLILICQKLI